MKPVILDVRERDEFEAEHIEHSINVPLSHFASVAPGVLNQLTESKVLVMCRSGARARLANQQIAHLGFLDRIKSEVFEGGILEWKKLGNPTIIKKRTHLPVLRQVQIGAGSFILLGVVLGFFIHPALFGISAFVGAGLVFAGVSGICMLANLLALMPWNKLSPSTSEELCQASPGNSTCKE